MPRPISATISVSSLRHNLNVVAQKLREESAAHRPLIWAVIKAHAYGHGIDTALKAFAEADGLAMLDLDEAIRCRERGWQGPILLLEGMFEPADVEVCRQYRLSTVIHTQEQLDMLKAAPPGVPLDAFVKLETGMHRLGFSSGEYVEKFQQAKSLQAAGVLASVGKMTHFARADDDEVVTHAQIDLFNRVTAGLPGPVSVCNSAGSLTPRLWEKVQGGDEQWVRPGICLYGASPFADKPASQFGLRPAMTLRSRLIGVHDVPPGECVGYGHKFTCETATRVGVVACGYADGYPRHAVTGTPITVAGVRTRTLGRVSMDMLVADLTPVPHANVGAEVVLWGEGGPSVDEVAQASDTIGYELLCALAPRVPRTIIE